MKEHCLLYMLEILDPKQQGVFYACLLSVVQQYALKIFNKTEKVSRSHNAASHRHCPPHGRLTLPTAPSLPVLPGPLGRRNQETGKCPLTVQPVVDIDGAVTQLMAKWIQQQQSKVQRLVASATDSEGMLADPLCNMSAPVTLDVIYMTSELKDPFVARPYLWDLLRLLQTKLAKIQAFCLKNGLDAAKWSA